MLLHTSSAVYQALTDPGLQSPLNSTSLMESNGELPLCSACAPSMDFLLNWVVCATNAKINVSCQNRDMRPPVMWVVDKSYKNVCIHTWSWFIRRHSLLTIQWADPQCHIRKAAFQVLRVTVDSLARKSPLTSCYRLTEKQKNTGECELEGKEYYLLFLQMKEININTICYLWRIPQPGFLPHKLYT